MSVPTPHAARSSAIPDPRARRSRCSAAPRSYWEYGPAGRRAHRRDRARLPRRPPRSRAGHRPAAARSGSSVPTCPASASPTPMTEAPHSIDGYARWLGGVRRGARPAGAAGGARALLRIDGRHPRDRRRAAAHARSSWSTRSRPTRKVGAGVMITRLTRAFYGVVARAAEARSRTRLLRNWLDRAVHEHDAGEDRRPDAAPLDPRGAPPLLQRLLRPAHRRRGVRRVARAPTSARRRPA